MVAAKDALYALSTAMDKLASGASLDTIDVGTTEALGVAVLV